jgi:predicted PurR-regulated permease PerM
MNSDDTPPPRPWPAAERALVVLAVLAVIGAAKVTESFLVPVVAGVMLSYTLEPLVRGLERVRIHRAIGSAVVLLCVIGIVGVSGFLLRDDAKALMAQLPDAAHQIRLAALARKGPEGPIDHVRAAAAELNKAAAEATGTAPAPQAVATPPTLSTDIQHWITDQSAKMLGVVTQLGIAALLAYFLLAAGDTFRRKVVHLAGPTLARRRITVEILDDIHIQVQRYLVVLLFTNMLIALAIWGVLTLSGIDRAGLWGAIAGVLHVIPYAGTALTTGAIAVAVYVQTQSLGSTFGVALAVLTVSSAIGMGLVPWLQGKAARMNAAAVFVALLFFGWLWGGWGLLLGAPLAAVLKTIADRIPRMDAVGELMGGADVGTPAVPKVSEEAPRPQEAPATRARSRRATRATG